RSGSPSQTIIWTDRSSGGPPIAAENAAVSVFAAWFAISWRQIRVPPSRHPALNAQARTAISSAPCNRASPTAARIAARPASVGLTPTTTRVVLVLMLYPARCVPSYPDTGTTPVCPCHASACTLPLNRRRRHTQRDENGE